LSAVALAKAGPEGYVRNEPIFVKHVIQKIADLRGLSFDEVASATFQNAKNLFKIV
jgi:TatD DNase family protein